MRYFVLILTLTFDLQIDAQTLQQRADSLMDVFASQHKIASFSVGFSIDHEIVWAGARGYSDLEEETRATPETIYRIASLTKVITATAIMQLVEKGKIDMNASVQTYLPDYPLSKRGEIKVRDLIYHTSGINHYRSGEAQNNTVNYPNLRQASRYFENRRLLFKPGTRYKYSSFGYTLLGAILEEVSGLSYQEYIKKNILDIANMNHTAVEDRLNPNPRQASLYELKGSGFSPDFEDDLSRIYSAGGLTSTVEDLLKFVHAFEQDKLLGLESREKMLTPPRIEDKVLNENAGMGWNIWSGPKYGRGYSRVGGQSGASALWISYRDQKVSVVLLANQPGLNPIWDIVNAFSGIALQEVAKR